MRVPRILVLDLPQRAEVLGKVFEPQIIAMSPQTFTLSGYELVSDQLCAQRWLVRAAEMLGAVGTDPGCAQYNA